MRARRERGAGQDRGRAAIAEHLRRPVVRIVGIERHVCRARLQHREQADDERRRAVEPHRDEVARGDAARAQALRERVAVGLQSRIVERAAAAGHRDRVRGLLRARIDQVVHAPLARMVGARAAAKREQPFALGRGQHRAIGHPRGGRREHAVEQRQIVARHRLHGGRAIPRAVVLPVQRETRGAAGRRSFDHLEHELILTRLTNLADRFDVVAEAQAREKILIHERDPVHRRAVLRALQAELANQRAERILHRHGVDELALHALEHRHDGGLAGQARAQRQHVDEEAERVAVTLRRPRVGRHADDDVGLAGIAMQQQLEHAEEERGGAEMVRLDERRDARRPRRVERHRMPCVARRALGRGRRRRGQLERGRQRVELPPPVRDAARALVAVEKRALLGDEIVVRGGRRARRGLDAVDERAVCVEQRADQQQQRLPVEHQVVHVQRHDRVRRAEPARGRRVARAPAGEIEQMHAAKRAVLERERLPRLLAQPREDRGLVGVGAERVGERRLDGLERRAGRLHPPRLAVDHADRRAQRRILPRDEAQRAAKRVRPQIAHGEAKRHVIGAAILVQRMQRPDPALPLRKRQTRAVARAPAKLARQIGGRQLPFAVGTNHITDDGVHLVFSIK
ncbi:putative non-ribosomal peptide synthase [Burkholderia pseudomallei]|nr:putative non-ribosomal peptide synthase [Burkholderia pseudomallei]KGD34569.1 putative non-ribosomal peptide synthase [Burkholderia pseudomallei]